MRYGFRIVPTDRALAGRPPRLSPAPCPPQKGRVCRHLRDSSRPCFQQANLELVGEEGSEGSRCLPTQVPLHETHTFIHHGVGVGLFDFFILLAVKETVLNIWKPDLSEKLRLAAQAAWRGQQLCWALAEDGLLGSPDNGQGGRRRKRVEKQGRGLRGTQSRDLLLRMFHQQAASAPPGN